MSDFGDMLREALVANEPYRPDEGAETLERSVRHFRTRMRTVRALGALLVLGPTLFLAAGVWLFLQSGPLGSDVERVLYALLALFGLAAVGMGKLWTHAMVSHVQVMRELKTVQLALARLAERG